MGVKISDRIRRRKLHCLSVPISGVHTDSRTLGPKSRGITREVFGLVEPANNTGYRSYIQATIHSNIFFSMLRLYLK